VFKCLATTRSRCGPRLSLRALLGGVLLLAIWLGWVANRAHRRGEALAKIERMGAAVSLRAQTWPRSKSIAWITSRLGDEFFFKVLSVDFSHLAWRPRNDLDLVPLGFLKELRDLNVAGGSLNNAGISTVGGLLELETLNLSGCHLGDQQLSAVAGLRNLKRLNLSYNAITGLGLSRLSRFDRLETLELSANRLGNIGVTHLRALTSVKNLDLSLTDVDDTGLSEISGLAQLECINLIGTRVSDRGLAHLRHLRKLKVLYLVFCSRVTPVGVAKLAPLLPGTSISWCLPDGQPVVSKGSVPAALLHQQSRRLYPYDRRGFGDAGSGVPGTP
jgi:Leucine rich repeat/Leucine Rich repeat